MRIIPTVMTFHQGKINYIRNRGNNAIIIFWLIEPEPVEVSGRTVEPVSWGVCVVLSIDKHFFISTLEVIPVYCICGPEILGLPLPNSRLHDHVGSLNSAVVVVFTPWKSTHATHLGFFIVLLVSGPQKAVEKTLAMQCKLESVLCL